MYPCLSTVRAVIRDTLTTLTGKIPNIRIGLIAHGDYDTMYTIKGASSYQFCSKDNLEDLIYFITNVGPNPGWTAPEAYELVLKKVVDYDWTEGSNKSLGM